MVSSLWGRCSHICSLALQWLHNEHDSLSSHQPHDCLLNHIFRHRSKKTSKLRLTGLCAGNSPWTTEFPAQMASNAENGSIWWRHHDCPNHLYSYQTHIIQVVKMFWKCKKYACILKYIFSCEQAALRTLLSVCPSFTHFSLCSHHHIITKFSGMITNDKSDPYAKGQDQKSKVKVTQVKRTFSCLGAVTPFWIHIWLWTDAQSIMWLRGGALLFFKVVCQISRLHGSKNLFWPKLGISRL